MRLSVLPFLLFAAPAAAETDIRALIIEEAQKTGCVLTEAAAEQIFPAAGLTQEDVRPVAEAMIDAGEAALVGDEFHLLAGLCTATEAAPPPLSPVMAAVVSVFNANGCLLNDANALDLLAAAGVSEADIEAIEPEIEAMIESGQFTELDDEAKTVRLEPPLCTAAAPAPAISPKMALVVEVFRQNGCELDEENGMAALKAAGITEADMDAMDAEADALEALGLVTRLDDGTGRVRMQPPLCPGGAAAPAPASADPAEPLIRMLRENGCRLTQDAAAGLVGGYGLSMEAADEMADSLLDRGLARVEGEALALVDCGG